MFRISLLFIIFLTVSCQKNTEIDKKHQEIMKIHDDVMPLMKDIYRIKKSLKSSEIIQDSLVENSLEKLDKAEDLMMDWMAGYTKPSNFNPETEKYLNDQLVQVKEMAELLKKSIEEGEYLYKTIKQ